MFKYNVHVVFVGMLTSFSSILMGQNLQKSEEKASTMTPKSSLYLQKLNTSGKLHHERYRIFIPKATETCQRTTVKHTFNLSTKTTAG